MEEVRYALEDILDLTARSGDQEFRPELAFVFVSIKQDWVTLRDLLHRKGLEVLGATSSGEFTEAGQSEGGIAVLLLELPKEDFTILFEPIGERTMEDAAMNLARRAFQTFDHPAFILLSTLLSADGKMLEGETLIRSIEKVTGPQVTLFGGMAGDDISFTGTYVFTHDQSTDYGLVALILNEEKVSLSGMAISGWKPVGVARTITKSRGNLLYTIDGQPALDMYLRFLGMERSSAEDQVRFFDTIGVHYPFQIEREGREPMMCNPIGYNKEEGALICESDIREGSRFRFSTPPDFDILETVVGKANELKMQTHAKADALLIFSCAGRLSALGPLARDENEKLAGVWNVPMAGFYTYGEFGKGPNGKHEFHSTTNSWVVLKEK